ncbi:MAG: glycosyltransferase [Gammaproteobacteria bacterium]|nr:glycosyltransferase [Gammaproteobacteria bacterium]
MRIVIDLQGAQTTGSRNRGIGRYSLSLAQAIARQRDEHEIIIVLNGIFADSIDPIRRDFAELLPAENIKVWHPLKPVYAADPANVWRRKASEAIREFFLASLQPDMVLVSSLFEGFGDDSLTSVGQYLPHLPTAVVLYDLIPFIYPKPYLENPAISAWYHNKIDHVRRADLLLAISASSGKEAAKYLGIPEEQTVNISSAIDISFRPQQYTAPQEQSLRIRYGLQRPFVMYTGGIDHRKNIEGLIAAFARLSAGLRQHHQLAVVCAIQPHDRKRLQTLALKQGLSADDVIFTGFIPNEDLLALYNLCHLFVFPSGHEGFGLPALEAMACGAPTLASNCSSLPEVVGWDGALFDPYDISDMARAIESGLTDDGFRQQLRLHGLEQARKFSWDASAQRALQAMEAWAGTREAAKTKSPSLLFERIGRPRLAYVSPLQAAQSGISDYSAELLPELARHYLIDVVVDQQEPVTDPWVVANATQRSLAWFEQHAGEYDRILYHFGNSHFHQHMFGLLERHPGVVVLHDFFLSGIVAYMDCQGANPGILARALQRAHGWRALQQRYAAEDVEEVMWEYPCNLDVLQQSLGIICHSHHSRRLAALWYGAAWEDDWALVPLLRAPVVESQRDVARDALGLGDNDLLVCSFGLLGPTKLNHRLLEAFQASSLVRNKRCHLVFVGALPQTEYGEQIRQMLQLPELRGHVRITGWADEETYHRYLAASDVAVQLRTLSRGETSAAVLDCMNHGIATIVNDNGSMADLPADVVHLLPDDFDTADLRQALEWFYSNAPARRILGARAAQHIRTHHNPRQCADQYAQAIEDYYARAAQNMLGLTRAVGKLGMPTNPQDLADFAQRTTEVFLPPRPAQRQLLVSVSELVQHDAKTEIHRVTRSVLRALLEHPPTGFRVEPVYATLEHGYRYARCFTAQLLGIAQAPLRDDPVEKQAGDVFFGLDLEPLLLPKYQAWLQELRHHGVSVYFLVHDILPCTLPEYTTRDTTKHFALWLQTVALSDGLLCVSRSVADELINWLDLFGPHRSLPLQIGWTHLGADFTYKLDSHQLLEAQSAQMLHKLGQAPTFLMVGTLEPRKHQSQALAAFELLWRAHVQVNLVIVGKQGWMVDELAERLHRHPERERHLFWLEGISDDLLERLYDTSTCMIAASADEGFGLPLIKAAQHQLPILARDIPVFREVAGEHASYFTGDAPQHLAEAVNRWLQANQTGSVPQSHHIPWLTWQKCTQNMLGVILGGNWYRQWLPQADPHLVARYWGSDWHLDSMVGEVSGIARQSMGVAGNLLHGPYIPLTPGRYAATIQGTCGFGGPAGAKADVVMKGGTVTLAREDILVWDDAKTEQPLAILPFVLEDACTDLEVRVHVGEESDVRVSMVEILKYDVADQASSTLHAHWISGQKVTSVASFFSAEVHRYWATHPRLHSQVARKVSRALATQGKPGFLLYGPYIGLPAGTYRATVFGNATKLDGVDGAWMDAAASKDGQAGALQFAKAPLATDPGRPGHLGEITFTLNRYTENLEIRVWVAGASELLVTGIQIEPVPEVADGTDVLQVTPIVANVIEIRNKYNLNATGAERAGEPGGTEKQPLGEGQIKELALVEAGIADSMQEHPVTGDATDMEAQRDGVSYVEIKNVIENCRTKINYSDPTVGLPPCSAQEPLRKNDDHAEAKYSLNEAGTPFAINPKKGGFEELHVQAEVSQDPSQTADIARKKKSADETTENQPMSSVPTRGSPVMEEKSGKKPPPKKQVLANRIKLKK